MKKISFLIAFAIAFFTIMHFSNIKASAFTKDDLPITSFDINRTDLDLGKMKSIYSSNSYVGPYNGAFNTSYQKGANFTNFCKSAEDIGIINYSTVNPSGNYIIYWFHSYLYDKNSTTISFDTTTSNLTIRSTKPLLKTSVQIQSNKNNVMGYGEDLLNVTSLGYAVSSDKISSNEHILFSSLTIKDENGNNFVESFLNPNISVFYEFKDGIHTFVVDSPDKLALSFDFCEFDSEYKWNFGFSPFERLEKHSVFDINDLSPVFRYNEYGFTSSFKTKKSYSFEEMQSLDDDNIKIAWWIDFFTNDEYSKRNGRTDEVLKSITSLLLDKDTFYNYTFERQTSFNKVTPSYSDNGYVWAYICDNLYNPASTKQVYDCYDADLLYVKKYGFHYRVKEYSAILTVSDDRYSEYVYYRGYATHIGMSYAVFEIPDSYIEYLNNKNYAWVVSYQNLDEVKAENMSDLSERHFVDYFVFKNKLHLSNITNCPYGDGITNDKSLIFDNKDSNNIVGSFGDDNTFNPIVKPSVDGDGDNFTLEGIKEDIKTVFSLIYGALPSEVVAIFTFLLVAYITIGFVKIILPLG